MRVGGVGGNPHPYLQRAGRYRLPGVELVHERVPFDQVVDRWADLEERTACAYPESAVGVHEIGHRRRDVRSVPSK